MDGHNEENGKVKKNLWKFAIKKVIQSKSPDFVDVVNEKKKRLRSTKCVADLSNELKDKTKSKAVYKKSRLYLAAVLLMSIFYSLPTIQMVFRLSYEQEISGSQDICYYNELCRRSLGSLSDFNHIFSNLGYCVFGLLFNSIVWARKQKYESFEKEMNKKLKHLDGLDVECSRLGVPRQYSLYYAMGLALVMQGVMSACYHVCPTEITFQFDTTFMYLIAILMLMKLYQVKKSHSFFQIEICYVRSVTPMFLPMPWWFSWDLLAPSCWKSFPSTTAAGPSGLSSAL